jgi:DNA-binding transcriptional LysR family regulator
MNLNHLKAFLSVAKHKSFTLACKELSLSQPTISLHVQKLEKHCSNPLLIRKAKQTELTNEGQMVYSYAEKIFALVGELEKAISELNDPNVKVLKMGATPLTVKDLALKIICNLKKRYPDIRIQLFSGAARQILEKVINFEYYVGIVPRMPYPDNVVYKHIKQEKLYFITADKKMAEQMYLKDLSKYPIVLQTEGVVYREIIINEFKARGAILNVYAEAADPTTIKSMVNQGLGGAFMPLYTIEEDAKEGRFRIIEILDGLHFDFDIIYLIERRKSTAVKSILSAINEVKLFSSTVRN